MLAFADGRREREDDDDDGAMETFCWGWGGCSNEGLLALAQRGALRKLRETRVNALMPAGRREARVEGVVVVVVDDVEKKKPGIAAGYHSRVTDPAGGSTSNSVDFVSICRHFIQLIEFLFLGELLQYINDR